MSLHFTNGSRMWLRSAEEPTSLEAMTLGFVWGDEVGIWKHASYLACQRRMRQVPPGYNKDTFRPRTLFTFTPKGMNHWTYALIEKPVKFFAPPWVGLEMTMDVILREDGTSYTAFDNPANAGSYIGRIHMTHMGTPLERQELYGEYVEQGLRVHPGFDRDKHVGQLPPRKDFSRFVAGIDWGWTHPGCLVIIGEERRSKRLWVVHEEYHVNVPYVGADIGSRNGANWLQLTTDARKEWPFEVLICGHDEPGVIEQFRRAGLPARDRKWSVEQRNSYTDSLLAQGNFKVGDGVAPVLVGQFYSYEYETDSEGKSIGKILKQNDDAMDALSYALEAIGGRSKATQPIGLGWTKDFGNY